MKVLILSCNTGQGHNSAARAVQEQFIKRGIRCDIRDALSFASKRVSKYVCNIYINTTIVIPSLFGAAYRASEAISSPTRMSPSYYANSLYTKPLYKFIMAGGYDVVIMPHVFPSEAMTYIRKKYNPPIKMYTISTDYSWCPFFEETNMDYYFIPHKDLSHEFIEHGMDKDKLIPTGIPVSEKFVGKTEKGEARRILSLPHDCPIMLIMSGSAGAGHTQLLLKELVRRVSADTRIIILAGNNSHLKSALRRKYGGDKRVIVKDFTKQVPLYMDACDILFTRPGGLSTTEAAVKNILFVHTVPVPGCETTNVDFFSSHKLCGFGADTKSAVSKAIEILSDKNESDSILSAQREIINKNAAADICEYILKDVEK